MALARRFLLSRLRSFGAVSDLVIVATTAQKMVRRAKAGGGRSRAGQLLQSGELLLAGAALFRLARRSRKRRRAG